MKVFMRNHLLHLVDQYEVTATAHFSTNDISEDWFPGVRQVSIPIVRQINLLADLQAFYSLVCFFRKERFDAVHSVTPKAGLLAMVAARFANVPHRIHCFTGQVWATKTGIKRILLKNADRFIISNANHVLADSVSQREFLESERIVTKGMVEILGEGSLSGVDTNHFRPDNETRTRIRSEWGIPPLAFLLLFVGRLTKDKGILDLAKAFAQLAHKNDGVWLAVIGKDEDGINDEFKRLCGDTLTRIKRFDYVQTPASAMAAADILVLPSYREGFGAVVIEAAACGIPTVATRIYGLIDAVEENVTGLLHATGDIEAMQDCIQRLYDDNSLCIKLGHAARSRVQEKFSMETVTSAFVDFYKRIFKPYV